MKNLENAKKGEKEKMKDTKITVADTADGKKVAEIFGGSYLNTFETGFKDFMELMWQADYRVKHNFTMLCMVWFKYIAYVDFYDKRNEESIHTAQEILTRTQHEKIYFEQINNSVAPHTMRIDTRSDADMQAIMECYLKRQTAHKEFMQKMLNMHRTLQQNFTRFCLNWLDVVKQKNVVGYVYTRIARSALTQPVYLPYI